MPEQRPLTCGCLRFQLALSEAEDLSNYKLPVSPLSRACRLLLCAAYSPDAGTCEPCAAIKCNHCPGAALHVEPQPKKDEPT